MKIMALVMAVFLTSVPLYTSEFSPMQQDGFRRSAQQFEELHTAELAAGRVYKRHGCGTVYAGVTAKYAIENRVPPNVLAALVVVESSCRPNAVSPEHAIGLAQIIPSWHHTTRKVLLRPDDNLRIGSGILGDNVHRWGLRKGLENYNGGSDKQEYAAKILNIAMR